MSRHWATRPVPVRTKALFSGLSLEKSRSLPEEGRVGVEVAAQITGEQQRLHMRHESPRQLLAQKRVRDLLALFLLLFSLVRIQTMFQKNLI